MADVVAAYDCGSNSTRLLIADAARTPVRREMTITRLSAGVDGAGSLSEAALERTYRALGRYRVLCDEAGVNRGLVVATSAVRDARNGAAFLTRACELTGVEARVVTGREEAQYSFAGATADLRVVDEPTVIVDVGGGSTELALGLHGDVVSYSMQLGCVRVSERALGHGVVSARGESLARAMIADELAAAFAAVPQFDALAGRLRLVGLAGTVATVAQLDAGVDYYAREVVHHRVVSRDTVEYWRTVLARETPEERLAHPGMVEGREDVIVAGLYVLEAVMDRLGVGEMLSSENDILDGIVASL